jgi:hypothetical protein
MRMRWLAVSGVIFIVAALTLHTLAPRVWPAAFFGRTAVAPGVVGSRMMNPGMMSQGGMMGTMMGGELLGDSSQPFDLRWLDSMIAHHQGGVVMTEHVNDCRLQATACPHCPQRTTGLQGRLTAAH